jgi:hypothetical protein
LGERRLQQHRSSDRPLYSFGFSLSLLPYSTDDAVLPEHEEEDEDMDGRMMSARRVGRTRQADL